MKNFSWHIRSIAVTSTFQQNPPILSKSFKKDYAREMCHRHLVLREYLCPHKGGSCMCHFWEHRWIIPQVSPFPHSGDPMCTINGYLHDGSVWSSDSSPGGPTDLGSMIIS